MIEFKPQRMASRPIFLIAFTVLAGLYTIWLVYAAVALGQSFSSYSVFFVLGVVILLWYSRMTSNFYVRIFDDHLEWKMRRNESISLKHEEIETAHGGRASVSFITAHGVYELNFDGFDVGGRKDEARAAIYDWLKKNNITLIDDSRL